MSWNKLSQLMCVLSPVQLCDPLDCSSPSSSAHGVSQARILQWVFMSFSMGIFPTQGSNPHLLYWQVFLPVEHQDVGTWVSVVVEHRLSCLQHVGSSWIRDRTCVPCIGRPIRNHWTTREVPICPFLNWVFKAPWEQWACYMARGKDFPLSNF